MHASTFHLFDHLQHPCSPDFGAGHRCNLHCGVSRPLKVCFTNLLEHKGSMWCGCPSDLWLPKYCGGHVQMQAISQVTGGQTRSNPRWKGTSIFSQTACHQMKDSHNIKIRLLDVTLKVKHFHWGRMPIYKFTVPRSSDKVPITLSGDVVEWLEEGNWEIKQRTSSDVREQASIFVNLYQNLLHVHKS